MANVSFLAQQPGLFQTQGVQQNGVDFGAMDPESAIEAQNLNRRQQIANLLIQQGLQPLQGQMAGRFYAAPSPWQGLANLAHLGAGAYLTNQIGQQQNQIGQAQNQQLTDAMTKYQAAVAPKPITTPAEGPGPPVLRSPAEQAGFMSGAGPVAGAAGMARRAPGLFQEGPQPTNTTMQPASPETKQQAIIDLLMQAHPRAQQIGKMLAQQQSQEAEHGAQRDFLSHEGVLNREARLESDKSRIDNMLMMKVISDEQASKMKTDLEAQHGETLKELHKMDIAGRKDVANIGAQAKVDAAEKKAAGGKALPGSIGAKFMENSQNLRMAERALDLMNGKTVEGMQGDPNATGLKNYLPDMLTQRLDPKGVPTRGAVANLGSMIVHDRSGAAVTASETPRLKPFIPSATDDPATVKKKLGQFLNEYRKIHEEMTQFYSEAGYNVPTSDWHRSPESTAPAGTLSPAEQQELDTLRKKHGR